MTPRFAVPQVVRDKARDEGRECVAWLADRTGSDAEAIWEWAIVLLVVHGRLWHQAGDAARNLHVAEAWADRTS